MTTTLVILVFAILEIIGIACAIHVLLTGRTSQGTIGWLATLITIPIVTVPIYLAFGPYKFTGYVIKRRRLKTDVHEFLDATDAAMPESLPDAEVARVAEGLADLPVTRYNDARLLVDGDAIFEAILEGIDAAEDYILVQYYILRDDEIGQELKRRLIARAREGVRIYVLYDNIGSGQLSRRYVEELRAAGIDAQSFGARRGDKKRWLRQVRINFRNHRKIVLVDGKKAWVGGANVGDEYLGRHPKLTPWRDTQVELEGPAVLGVQLAFVEDWNWAAGVVPDVHWTVSQCRSGRDMLALAMPSGPVDELETCALSFMHAINTAQERVWIASPYFVPDSHVLSAMELAVLRGVEVRVLIPKNADNWMTWLAAWSYLPRTEIGGIEIYEYQEGFMHQKVILVDDDYCSIGTANFDNRSFRLNFEIGIAFADTAFTAEVEEMLTRDFAKSQRRTLDEYFRRPWTFRLAVSFARLFAPIL